MINPKTLVKYVLTAYIITRVIDIVNNSDSKDISIFTIIVLTMLSFLTLYLYYRDYTNEV
jgi:positive regulator of sigma E activity